MKTVILKKQKDKLARNRNPWVFSGSVHSAESGIRNGEAVRVVDADKKFVAYGFYSEHSAITLRLFSWNEDEQARQSLFTARLQAALSARKRLINSEQTDSFRLLYGEADGLPGYVADYYNGHIGLQVNTASAVLYLPFMTEALKAVVNPVSIYARPADELNKKEKVFFQEACIYGDAPERILIKENGLKISANPVSGQKTGYYFDQRDNRKAVAQYAAGSDVLDCFCYTGGFSLNCAAAGAKSITSVDSSADALKNLEENFDLNGLQKPETVKADVFEYLRQRNTDSRKHDLVILDPPKLAKSQSAMEQALRAYKDINMLGLKKTEKNGIFVTFSCSGRVSREDFIKSVAWAAKDAGRTLRITGFMSQAGDHPISPFFPESEYLKGIIGVVE
ncbi:class I SAM-dependent rRNA methyltransferase [Seleniivibrio woodruffii]|uniref:23S rRNA (Cytosine1962-C5)-methyltransferase n=1 Tax=Seleniivibrio woodruffii TaxID=1078050 RepID=A0A4R1K802_9BACT|nr:class I SAM-dependent rRNA methyltransferase [Seleniivibrio woodruffii]TCK60394.1 23S rRNA (cytosine1962-C5)-methyltransferase [Seleniivibrio woodruffii]TVZ36021.1 23S rRNA (cytosine1962-C5)-methyltransferase [Seleniivibrio woodruffii]